MSAPSNNMRSLDRAFDVLHTLQAATQPLRLSEIARGTGLHIATAQRIINVLVTRGYAARSGDGYTAGPAALAVAHAYMMTNPLSVVAQQVLQQLAANTRFTASLYVRVEDSRVLVARVESDNPLSYVLPIGERLPLHLGGAGKLILADLDEEEQQRILGDVSTVDHADGRTIDRMGLLEELARIRADGYATSVSERLYGIASVTAPVRDSDGHLAAVLGITGPANALTPDTLNRITPEVRRAATSLGSRLPRH